MAKSRSATRLTKQSLQHLKDSGYRYVLIISYSRDRRVDFMDLNYFALIPVKVLSKDPNKMEIYAPIDSEILNEWACSPDEGPQVLIEPDITAP